MTYAELCNVHVLKCVCRWQRAKSIHIWANTYGSPPLLSSSSVLPFPWFPCGRLCYFRFLPWLLSLFQKYVWHTKIHILFSHSYRKPRRICNGSEQDIQCINFESTPYQKLKTYSLLYFLSIITSRYAVWGSMIEVLQRLNAILKILQ